MGDKKQGSEARAQLRAQIDENLKRVYQASLSDDLPDKFQDLLSRLRTLDETPSPEGSK